MCRNFDKSYLRIALEVGSRSYAVRHKVGAVIVKDNNIISYGFNGTPSGFDNCCENEVKCDVDWDELISSLDNGSSVCAAYNRDCSKCSHHYLVTKPEVLHAESNAITKLARSTQSSEGATLYVTLSPCFDCAKLIIQAGIVRVVYMEKYRSEDGLKLLEKAGIQVDQIENINDD